MLRSSRDWGFAAALVVTIALVYWPVTTHDYVYDDATYITENPSVQEGLRGRTVVWACTTFHASNWHPLTWLSHLLDVELFGPGPAGPHAVNVVLHAANAVLLFLLLRRTTGAFGPSAFASALFALHPLRVESVAWVAERKDVLSALFGFLTLHAYVAYTRRPTLSSYAWVLIAFALGLSSKPMLVTLPAVLLLLDYWPLERRPARWTRLVLEKVPLLVLALVSSGLTVLAQRAALGTFTAFPPGLRLANAAVASVAYLRQTFWPRGLAVLYPYPLEAPVAASVGSVLLLAGITWLCLQHARREPYLPVGWLWYLGTLVPVIGVVQVGVQSMADRYTYLPGIGIALVVAWGVPRVVGERPRLLAAAALTSLLVCSLLSYRQVGRWRNSRSLFAHALAVTEGNYVAHYNLANALRRDGDLEEAAGHYREALRLYPGYHEARMNLALLEASQGRHAEAERLLRETLEARPDDPHALTNLGILRARQGQLQEAARLLDQADRLRPGDAEVLRNLGAALLGLGRNEEAIARLEDAAARRPTDAELHLLLGQALWRGERLEDAARSFRHALALDPSLTAASRALQRIEPQLQLR